MQISALRHGLLLTLWALSAGCVTPTEQMASLYARDFKCEMVGTRVEKMGYQLFRITGCAGTAIYRCDGSRIQHTRTRTPICRRTNDSEDIGATHALVGRQVPSGNAPERVQRGKGTDGTAVLGLDLALSPSLRLSLRAAPVRYPDVLQVELSQSAAQTEGIANCEVGIMVDGERIASTAVDTTESDVRRIRMSRDSAFSMANAEQIAIRACDARWPLEAAQLGGIKNFVAAWREELAWSSRSSSGPDKPDASAGSAPAAPTAD